MPQEEDVLRYTVIRSDRKTLSLQWKQGTLTVRAPRFVSDGEIDDFVNRHRSWILRQAKRQQITDLLPPLSEEELRSLTKQARIVFAERVQSYAALMGVTYGRITIRHQRTRWGSCSPNGNLNFNCLLLLAPPEVLDSVVVHELCHRKHMNHSDRFYRELFQVYPQYSIRHNWLKQHGSELLARLPIQKNPPQKGERT
ncbi:MAG: DUF45 domain-containing protein [Clostridia bacterium]|nr:DUF45 domain-containing protein [Clostridia bacterium]